MSLQALEVRLGHTFADRELLRRALTHGSYAHEHQCADNERLEFLGDAVLQLCTTLLLMDRYPDSGEGSLSRLRSRLVDTVTLAELGRELELGPQLRLGVGEEASGGRLRTSILADATEAIVGALYIDAGFAVCARVLRSFLEPRLVHLEGSSEAPHAFKDPRSRLQELVQRHFQQTPTYAVIETSGPPHQREFTVEVGVSGRVLGRGTGRSKRGAGRQAAEAALHALDPE